MSVTVGLRRCVFPFSTLHIHLWASRCEARGFTILSSSPFRFVLFMLSRGLLPFSKLAGGGSSEHSDIQNLCSHCGLVEYNAFGFAAKSQTVGKGISWLLHTAPCALSFHAFGGGHRLENWIHMGGSRCSGRYRREDWRHPNVALSGPAFFCVCHPMVTGEAAPGDALWH